MLMKQFKDYSDLKELHNKGSTKVYQAIRNCDKRSVILKCVQEHSNTESKESIARLRPFVYVIIRGSQQPLRKGFLG